MRHYYLILGAIGLAACGGAAINPTTADRYLALVEQFEGIDPSNPSLLPTTESISYSGAAQVNMPTTSDPETYYGDMTLTVDFSTVRGGFLGDISGLTSDSNALSGELTIAGGRLDRSADPDDEYTYNATLNGVLTQEGTDYDVEGALNGEFLGRDQEGAQGVLSGSVTANGDRDIWDGAYIAVRDGD